jgi:hypothetical protein
MESPPRRESAPAPAVYSKGALRAVKVLALISVLIPGILILGTTVAFFPFGLILAAGYLWICYVFFSRLREDTLKRGLAQAIWVGVATLLLIVAWAAVPTEDFVIWNWKIVVGLCLAGLVPVALVVSAIKAYCTTDRQLGDIRVLFGALGPGALYLFVIFVPYAIAIPSLKRSSIPANQASAVGVLRIINTAMTTYQSTYDNSYAPSLKVLGPAPAGTAPPSPNCSAAGLIEEALASGRHNGYLFEFKPGPPAENVQSDCPHGVRSYTVTARPAKYGATGKSSYFTDESGTIRWTPEDRPATVQDPPLGG